MVQVWFTPQWIHYFAYQICNQLFAATTIKFQKLAFLLILHEQLLHFLLYSGDNWRFKKFITDSVK